MNDEYLQRMYKYAFSVSIPLWAIIFLSYRNQLAMHKKMIRKRLKEFKLKNNE